MFKNYFKVAWRGLRRNKISAFINIGGLAVGMGVAILIGLWIWDELTFNQYHLNHSKLAEIVSVATYNGSTTASASSSVPLATELKNNFSSDFTDMALVAQGNHTLASGDKKVSQWGMWAQAGFPSMFTLKMLKGSNTALSNSSSVIISASLAKTLFGAGDPINKVIKVDNNTLMNVGGVYEDIPDNSDFTGVNFLLAWHNKDNPANDNPDDWTNHHFQLFVQMSDHADLDKTTAKIKDISKPHLKGAWEEIVLYPMDRWHLYDKFKNGKMSDGQIQYVWLFGIIGGFVLLLACINFMNLSTARSEKRAKEVGIRKAIGSMRKQLISQFFCESFLVVFISLFLALLLAQLSLSYFNTLAGKDISIPYINAYFWLLVLGFSMFTGFVAGSYPAFYLSGFNTIKVLKGTFRAGKFASFPRKILVIAQFSVSIMLIIGTIVIYRQVLIAKSRPVGYTKEGLITVEMNTPELTQHYDALRNELMNSGVVENVAESSSPSTNVQNSMLGYDWQGRDPGFVQIIGTVFVDPEFGKTLGWNIKEGRNFSKDFPNDSGGIILNEAAAKLVGFEHPVGQSIKWHDKDHIILGVVNDMVMESPYASVEPTFFMLDNRKIHVITIRINPAISVHNALTRLDAAFKKYNPGSSFEYRFTDEVYAHKFVYEEYIGKLATIFSILTIFISCLGLFGLASFVAEQRTKEIGVRKVLGATVFSLWRLLSKEFAILVIISFCIATPISYYFMHSWLQNYQYRTQIYWWVFAVAGAGALLITLLTVSFQSIKAAIANPVKSLRSE